MYADIIVDISVESLDRTFQYTIPSKWEKVAIIGASVTIPFGKGNRMIQGFIIGRTNKPNYPVEKMKEIQSVEMGKVVIEGQLLQLAAWIHKHYGSTLNEALKTVLPVKRQVKSVEERWLSFRVTVDEARVCMELCLKKNHRAKARLLAGMLDEGSMGTAYATKKYKVPLSVMKGLEKQGILSITSSIKSRDFTIPDQEMEIKSPTSIENEAKISTTELNHIQKEIVHRFSKDYNEGIRKTYMIHGVTGSGKTEVYMKMAQNVIATGKQVIVLIPEIALTHQTVMRFRKTFGKRVSVLHSRMSFGERYDQYMRARNLEIDIMIGPRSALFIPMPNLGIIIIDEEHEPSYKNESTPKYHAREVAIERARLGDASVVLGSATPSLEAYTKAKSGEYQYYEMSERVGQATLPDIHIVDLRNEFAERNYSIFSKKLQKLMLEKLAKKEQIMLFLNRRGFAGFVSCRSCGEVLMCEHCDISYKTHKGRSGKVDALECHYCGHTIPMPEQCPKCGSKYIAGFGIGTEQLEQMTKKLFPNAKVLRMDADTTSGKNGHEGVLGRFRNKEVDILIGTQMIVKGHDFPTVTLVGVLAADLSMYAGDYHSSERTFQLLMQASGRAGRGMLSGEVVIQTYHPEHHCIQAVKEQSYEMFYEKEMIYRKVLRYPPVYPMMVILVLAKEEEIVKSISKELAEEAKHCMIEEISIIGPAKANISKINDWYRYTLYIKAKEEDHLLKMKETLDKVIDGKQYKKNCGIQFDMNPMNGY